MELNEVSGAVITAAMKVHTALGPGLLEEPYKQCLAYELKNCGLKVNVELNLPVIYNAIKVEVGYRLDLLVEDAIIVELKAVQQIAPIHRAQLLTYLKLSRLRIGLLLNFNTVHLKDGIVRLIN
jgi:GxxExxY protein